MERPDSRALDELEAVVTDLRETEAALKELKTRINEVATGLGDSISDPEALRMIANWVYWMLPEVNTTKLAEAVVGKPNVYRLLKAINTATAGIYCDRCGKSIVFKSRAALQQSFKKLQKNRAAYAEGYRVVCDDCHEAIFATRREAWKAANAVWESRLNELRMMPYRDYLRTSEWQERRKRHLQSAGYRCQVCNSCNAVLDVHHRTYARRGNEQYKDLIVLCRNCHSLFHRNGKLAYETT